VSSLEGVRKALLLMEERNASIAEIEREMEEQYELSTMRREAINLKRAAEEFMAKREVDDIEMEGWRARLVRRYDRRWNAETLKRLVSKSTFVNLCTLTPDAEKIDDMVRRNKVKMDDIAEAYEEIPQRPFLRTFYESDDGTDEAAELKAKLNA
jgi:hypothetical protein